MRGWGGQYSRCDPEDKAASLLRLMSRRRWNVGLLSDLAFAVDGVREFSHGGATWTLVSRGRAGVIMDAEFTQKWREGERGCRPQGAGGLVLQAGSCSTGSAGPRATNAGLVVWGTWGQNPLSVMRPIIRSHLMYVWTQGPPRTDIWCKDIFSGSSWFA